MVNWYISVCLIRFSIVIIMVIVVLNSVMLVVLCSGFLVCMIYICGRIRKNSVKVVLCLLECVFSSSMFSISVMFRVSLFM